ncbi:class A beta-lactamase [Novosphingobium sp.]|uniref:class A beta-lactamase n=1 Tax=Novosphingobium sp. TaxID=1874826 RepID=UPI00286B0541|nr:class A beta-lactamase [Novosphingobium sp.]
MKTGFYHKVLSGLALAGAVLAPVAPAHAENLETEFDKAFIASPQQPAASASQPPQLQASRVQPKVLPAAQTTKRTPPASVRPYVSQRSQRSYGGELNSQVASLADDGNGRIGVAAIDLTTGQTVSVLGDTPFPLASTSKIAIAATFLEGVDQGRFSLDAQYPLMVPVKSARFSGFAAPVRPGAMLTGRQLIERSLIHSDNQATDALLAVVGGPAAVNRWIRTTGISGFRIDRDIATLVRDDGEYNPAQMIDERDSATPMAMAQLLVGLYEGRWLSTSSRGFLIATMERCLTGKRRLRGQLPSDARVAHKTGTLNNTASDVGIVRGPNGHVYAVAIYVTGQGGHAGRDAKIAAISRVIYDGYVGPDVGTYASAQR